jgi:hypothetical protein
VPAQVHSFFRQLWFIDITTALLFVFTVLKTSSYLAIGAIEEIQSLTAL